MNSPSLCLAENIFILEDSFCWQSFPFSSLNIIHLPSGLHVSGEESICLTEDPLYGTGESCCFQDDLSVFWWFADRSWFGSLSGSCLEFIELLGCADHIFHGIWEVFGHYVFKYLSALYLSYPFKTPIMCMLVCFMVSCMFLGSVTSSLLLRLDNFKCRNFRLADASFCLLKSTVELL